MSSAGNTKKTVYVDVDEEITGIIDKVRSANESIIALVLPKRATMLQSVVNMKLLKRAADQSDKKVVLITSESTLMPLAGAAGLHVAPNLQSRPAIPPPPDPNAAAKAQAASEPDTDEKPIDPNTPIGDLAGDSDKNKLKPIEIDNKAKDAGPDAKKGAAAAADADKAGKEKGPKDKSKKVPNFNRFRKRLLIGGAVLLLLIALIYWAFFVAPKATVTLRTESSDASISAQFTADTEADEVDVEDKIVPAKKEQLTKSESAKVPATGEEDRGTKASGSVTLRNCTDDDVTIPAGTGVSNGSLTFITQSSVSLDQGEFSSPSSGGQCQTSGDHVDTVTVVAQNNGEQYNLSPRSYTVAGYGGVVAQGEEMSGGTTKIVKVVTAQDVENAKKNITDRQTEAVEEIKSQLQEDGYIGVVDTFSTGNPNYNTNPAVGAEANEVTVSAEVTYAMLGLKEEDLKTIIDEEAKDDIDTSRQQILDYGLDEAAYQVGNQGEAETTITLNTDIVAGPEIDQNGLREELAGKKDGEAEELLKGRPGITDARVELGPFWVTSIPGDESKVTFVVEQADGSPITP